MIANNHITKFVAVIVAVAVCLCFCAMGFSDKLVTAAGGTDISMEYESVLFNTDEIISVNILMDGDAWDTMLANATSEEYYQCDVEINGKMFYRVGIRPKGNTSLISIANDPNTDRFSLKLEFDQFVKGQTCFGLDKLVLNNNFSDATNMKEALIYDMYQYLGADASLYNFAKISVNNEYWGVYLALEAVEDSFLLRNYGVESGELYKPDSMDMDGGMGKGPEGFDALQFGTMAPSDAGFPKSTAKTGTSEAESDTAPSAEGRPDIADFGMPNISGFSMGGSGANLNYIDDDLDSYSSIWDSEITRTSKSDHKRVVKALKHISDGTDLETYMDVDNLLKYMAVHVFSVNEDSLSGNMAHNYYLYEYEGQLNILPWDYNLTLGGMGKGSDATSTVNDAIDNAFSGTKFFDTLMENEAYKARYHENLQQLVDEYLNGGGFEAFYTRTRSLIDSLVKTDPTAFYTYDEYTAAVETLYEVVKLRGESIDGQLDGTIPSTASKRRDSDALVDASHLDLSVMGVMNMGGNMGGSFNFGGGQSKPNTSDSEVAGDETGKIAAASADKTASIPLLTAPESNNDSGSEGTWPSGAPTAGSDPSQFGGEPPDSFSSERPVGFDPSAAGSSGSSPAAQTNNLATYVICFAVLLAALLIAKLYRRKPRRK